MDPSLSLLVEDIPSIFWRSVAEHMDARFALAHTAMQRYQEPEQSEMLGHSRNARAKEALRAAAEECGITALAPHTEPRGGRYVRLDLGRVALYGTVVQPHRGLPRRQARHRFNAALLNGWLTPPHPDLFDDMPAPPAGALTGIVVAIANLPQHDQSIPACVGVGIPDMCFKRWVRFFTIDELLRLRHAFEEESMPQPAAAEILDRAKPVLKPGAERHEG